MPDSETTTPSREDLLEIAGFLRDRSMDEARNAGHMEHYQQNGVTIQARFPKTYTGGREKASEWLAEHTPDRFMDIASCLATVAYQLADQQGDSNATMPEYRAAAAWRSLAKAARLWDKHPDFNKSWAEAA